MSDPPSAPEPDTIIIDRTHTSETFVVISEKETLVPIVAPEWATLSEREREVTQLFYNHPEPFTPAEQAALTAPSFRPELPAPPDEEDKAA